MPRREAEACGEWQTHFIVSATPSALSTGATGICRLPRAIVVACRESNQLLPLLLQTMIQTEIRFCQTEHCASTALERGGHGLSILPLRMALWRMVMG